MSDKMVCNVHGRWMLTKICYAVLDMSALDFMLTSMGEETWILSHKISG